MEVLQGKTLLTVFSELLKATNVFESVVNAVPANSKEKNLLC